MTPTDDLKMSPSPTGTPNPAPTMPSERPMPTELASVSPCAVQRQHSIKTAPADLVTEYNRQLDALVIKQGRVSMGGLRSALEQINGVRIEADGSWLLMRNLIIQRGAELTISGGEFSRLLLKSDHDGFVWIKVLGGRLTIEDACISSWDQAQQTVDTKYDDGRSFILARDGARMDIRRSDLSYLGYLADESYGLAWRLEGTSGELLDSRISYNFYGMYLYSVSDMHIRGNEVHHNVRYGIDPHTRSNRLLIENNISHHNGKQGIILAEECEDVLIRNNVVYGNGIHGIVVYQRSNRAIVEGNQSYENNSQGININDSDDVVLRNNQVYANHEDGIGIGQNATGNTVIANTVRANLRDGITIYSDASNNTIRENDVHGNGRYGIYVKVAGNYVVENAVQDNVMGNVKDIGPTQK